MLLLSTVSNSWLFRIMYTAQNKIYDCVHNWVSSQHFLPVLSESPLELRTGGGACCIDYVSTVPRGDMAFIGKPYHLHITTFPYDTGPRHASFRPESPDHYNGCTYVSMLGVGRFSASNGPSSS